MSVFIQSFLRRIGMIVFSSWIRKYEYADPDLKKYYRGWVDGPFGILLAFIRSDGSYQFHW